MKRAKQCTIIIAVLFSFNNVFAQKDSIQALFKPVKFNIHYSNLQWEEGYNGYLFKNSYIGGAGIDLFGIVFNEVNFAFGFDEAGSGTAGRTIITNFIVQSYSDFYFKIEPMLFPEKIINLSMPIKIAYSSLGYSDTATSTATQGGGYGRGGYGRRRGESVSFPSITPGVFTYVNVFTKVNIGVGINYRLALKTYSTGSPSDYDNLSFSALIRFRLAFRNKNKIAPDKDDYYQPGNRFQ
ncbi:MAG: hypothetical protein ACLQQ4_09165 [Bacteroidia bacterium]